MDLTGRALDAPVHALLCGAYRDRIEDPGAMVETALEQIGTYGWLKLYAGRVETDADLDSLRAVRGAVGPDIKLFVDIDGMWPPSHLVRALPRVHDIGIRMLEQPQASAASGFQTQFVGGLKVDTAADEAVRTVSDAAMVVRERTATVINVGHSKL